MNILSINAGSSSLKYQLIDTATGEAMARGVVERIGAAEGRLKANGVERAGHFANHEEAVSAALETLPGGCRVDGAGHRVVHGGGRFRASVLIDDEVEDAIEKLSHLAPLHNPVNLAGIRAGRTVLPSVPHVAVFDTAFHATIPAEAYTYALPYGLAEKWGIRRYGFHGISHRFVTERYAAITGRSAESVKLITLHLGNGCSACAVRGGESVDSSMGMTPLEGLVMGTRPGDIDPAIALRLMEWEGWGREELESLLNHKSGLAGLSGVSNDMRELTAAAAAGNARAALAIDVFCYRIRRYVGALFGVLNGAEAVVFTGGIGENRDEVRMKSCGDLEALGIRMDADRNARVHGEEREVSAAGSKTAVWVIPTNEELLIAKDAEARIIHAT
ncbi:MAG: acetate kinase [Bryobacteraceae bacterium]|nr:acetate kinase [Bryobacteraceae bacterium]